MMYMEKLNRFLANRKVIQHIFEKRFQSRLYTEKCFDVSRKYLEVNIPVPWGTIAGKWWGPTDRRPILCIHGWQDNCGSYDLLIPLLPENIPYLAVDYPGHGLSSQIPPGMMYYAQFFPIFLRIIQKHFNWNQTSILAHSLGASLCFLYASLFPEDLDMFIVLDPVKPCSVNSTKLFQNAAKHTDLFLKYDTLNTTIQPPEYTHEEIIKKYYDSRKNLIDHDKIEILFKRGIKASKFSPGKYHFTHDIRLKSDSVSCWKNDNLLDYSINVKCPMLAIKPTESVFPGFEKYKNTLKENIKDFNFVEVKGKHHVHLNKPENVSGIIADFITKYDKDRDLGGEQNGLFVDDKK